MSHTDDDNVDEVDQNYQNKKRKLSDKVKRIKVDKLERLKHQAKLECKDCLDEIQDGKLHLKQLETMKTCFQEKIRNFNSEISKLLK